jgi:hypothetical protein
MGNTARSVLTVPSPEPSICSPCRAMAAEARRRRYLRRGQYKSRRGSLMIAKRSLTVLGLTLVAALAMAIAIAASAAAGGPYTTLPVGTNEAVSCANTGQSTLDTKLAATRSSCTRNTRPAKAPRSSIKPVLRTCRRHRQVHVHWDQSHRRPHCGRTDRDQRSEVEHRDGSVPGRWDVHKVRTGVGHDLRHG